MDDHRLDPRIEDIRRIEVITGTGRRRRWPAETKARIIAVSLAGEASVSEVARRYGLRPQQLFGWRHQARRGELAVNGDEKPAFVPAVADGSASGAPVSRGLAAGSMIEIEVAGMIVRVRGRVMSDALVEVLAAVKRVR